MPDTCPCAVNMPCNCVNGADTNEHAYVAQLFVASSGQFVKICVDETVA